MADDKSGYKHDASDRKLDQAAEMAGDSGQSKDTQHSSGAGHDSGATAKHHDPASIAKHDDAGKDRLFEGREQHDDAEKSSEKSRLARDVDRHHHDTDGQAVDTSGDAKQ